MQVITGELIEEKELEHRKDKNMFVALHGKYNEEALNLIKEKKSGFDSKLLSDYAKNQKKIKYRDLPLNDKLNYALDNSTKKALLTAQEKREIKNKKRLELVKKGGLKSI
jgi:hypothetical protein